MTSIVLDVPFVLPKPLPMRTFTVAVTCRDGSLPPAISTQEKLAPIELPSGALGRRIARVAPARGEGNGQAGAFMKTTRLGDARPMGGMVVRRDCGSR